MVIVVYQKSVPSLFIEQSVSVVVSGYLGIKLCFFTLLLFVIYSSLLPEIKYKMSFPYLVKFFIVITKFSSSKIPTKS